MQRLEVEPCQLEWRIERSRREKAKLHSRRVVDREEEILENLRVEPPTVIYNNIPNFNLSYSQPMQGDAQAGFE